MPTDAAASAVFEATIDHYLAPLRPYLADTAVSEVMVNRFDDVFIERDGRLVKTDAAFADAEAYEAAVNNVLQYTGRSISDEAPLVDARLPDGSRVHVAKPPCARHGTVMTIRKFSKQMLDMDWLVELGTLTPQAREYLDIVVRGERNLLVSGGTSAGKTSLLNAMSVSIPAGERIVVIEDSAELQLQQAHVISLESKPPDRYGRGRIGIRDLFRSSLRLRPDRIVIGEVRGGEALDMIQAMTSGHGGSMGTLHAETPADALNRLETMALMSEVELPLFAIRAQIGSAIDVVVQMSRHIGGKRLVTQITEIDGHDEGGRYRLRDIFTLVEAEDQAEPAESGALSGPDEPATAEHGMQLKWTGERSTLAGRLRPSERARLSDLTRDLFT